MSASDLYAYRSCYCESCHHLREDFGITATAAVNYDMTFNAIVLNSLSPDGIKEQNARRGAVCILGRCTGDNEILRRTAGYTVLLTKWELEDDKHDHPTLRSNAARIALGRAIRKAERMYPEYDKYIGKGSEELRKAEERGCGDVLSIGKQFASSLMPAMKDIAGGVWNEHLETMLTGLGTLIYVLDAADDLDEDHLNGTFNPFLAGCEDYRGKKDFLEKNLYTVTDIVASVMKDIRSSYVNVRNSMHFHQGITDNVIYHGLPGTAERIISCRCSARPGVRNAISSRVLRKSER